jgi:hypothetical protein
MLTPTPARPAAFPTATGATASIRVKGHLDTRWAASFDGLSLTPDSDGSTVIHGDAVDQAALHGLHRKVRDVGLPLVSVFHVGSDRRDTSTEPQ